MPTRPTMSYDEMEERLTVLIARWWSGGDFNKADRREMGLVLRLHRNWIAGQAEAHPDEVSTPKRAADFIRSLGERASR